MQLGGVQTQELCNGNRQSAKWKRIQTNTRNYYTHTTGATGRLNAREHRTTGTGAAKAVKSQRGRKDIEDACSE
eukprot:3705467-Amphidinium_carterae.2